MVFRLLLGVLTLLTAVTAAGAGCAGESSVQAEGKLQVVAAFSPIAEAVARVGGSGVDVMNLSGGGVEPHEVELTTDQMDAVSDADIVFYLGGGFQPAVDEAVKQRKGVSVDLLSAVPTRAGDPHVWLDPVRYNAMTTNIANALSESDPSTTSTYLSNLKVMSASIDSLKVDFEKGLANCERRDIVTAHKAFGYLAERYKLTERSASGLVPESEPDPSVVAELTDVVRRTGATTVFTEELAGDNIAEVIAREANVKVGRLATLEVYSAKDEKNGATYETKMRGNLSALRGALGCT